MKEKNNLIGFAIVFTFLVAAMTLGGLGTAAVRIEPFFWLPFAINVFVYGYIIREFWRHWKEGK